MKKLVRNSIAIALSFVGAMVGVGLASGREIVLFFAQYGFCSLAFLFVFALVFFVLIYGILLVCFKNNHKNKKRKNENKNKKYELKLQICNKKYKSTKLIDVVFYFCQIAFCSAMFAGVYSLWSLVFLSRIVVVFIVFLTFVLSVWVLCIRKKNIFSINLILSVLLILFSVLIFVLLLVCGKYDCVCGVKFSWWVLPKSVLYAGMNVLTIYPLLIEKSRCMQTKKEIFIVSTFASIFMFLILFVFCLCILFFGGKSIFDDMVMLSISSRVSRFVGVMHFLLILFSVFSTLLTTAYGAGVCLGKNENVCFLFLNLSVSFVLSFIGFSNLINFIYPALGGVFIVYSVCLFIRRGD